MSKTRFIAAQYQGYFADDGWLKTASHANAMTARLAEGLRQSNVAQLEWQADANELFPIVAKSTLKTLQESGARFHVWDERDDDTAMIRLVTSFATTPADVDGFLAVLRS